MALITFTVSATGTLNGTAHAEAQTFQVEASRSMQFTRTLGTTYESLIVTGTTSAGSTYVLLINHGTEAVHVRIGAGGATDYGFLSLVEGGHMFISDSMTYDIFGAGDWGIDTLAARSASATGSQVEVVVIYGVI